MNMYDLMWGNRSQYYGEAKKLLGEDTHLGRFRDVWFENIRVDGEVDLDNLIVVVYTRNGGGNREDQAQAIDSMRAHSHYVSDEDDSFDETYAVFRFRFTVDEVCELGELDKEEVVASLQLPDLDPIDTGERWKDGLIKIGADPHA